jgi:hypothetical protein
MVKLPLQEIYIYYVIKFKLILLFLQFLIIILFLNISNLVCFIFKFFRLSKSENYPFDIIIYTWVRLDLITYF